MPVFGCSREQHHLLAIVFRSVIGAYHGPPSFRTAQSGGRCHDILVRRRRPAGLSSGYVGTITGTIMAANVTGPTTQGIDIGDLDSALKAVRAGLAYANMHTTNFAGGEIRGQVRRGNANNGD